MLQICVMGGILFLVSNLWFYIRILRPLRRLVYHAQDLTRGNLDSFECDCGGIREIDTLRRAMAGMVGHVRRAQKQSKAYADRLAEGQEQERSRLARELHDDTIQSLIAILHHIDFALEQAQDHTVLQMLQTVRTQVVETVRNLRRLIGDLRPPALDELGLVTALTLYLDRISQMKTTLQVHGIPRRLPHQQELTLFRAAQEAITNAIRHSGGDHVHITVDYQPDATYLTVKDNGKGFQVPAYLSDFEGHYGLIGIQERVESLQGKLTVDTTRGTQVTVCIPAQQQQPEGLVRDPVCSVVLQPQQAYGKVDYRGKTYYFCCPVCQGAFQKEPHTYVVDKAIAP
ncbi:MAG: hypothetical protein Kow00117_16760 [Phototrophicales bacterium]